MANKQNFNHKVLPIYGVIASRCAHWRGNLLRKMGVLYHTSLRIARKRPPLTRGLFFYISSSANSFCRASSWALTTSKSATASINFL